MDVCGCAVRDCPSGGFVIPVNMVITSSLGVLFAQLVISGLFGGDIAMWTTVKAIYFVIIYPVFAFINDYQN